MPNRPSNVIPFSKDRPSGFAEAPCVWQVSEDSLDTIRRGVWGLERAELTQAGVVMAEHAEDALQADAESDFLDAAKVAFSLYERILVEAGSLSHPLSDRT